MQEIVVMCVVLHSLEMFFRAVCSIVHFVEFVVLCMF